jgi:hypothetical protein
MKLSQTTNKDGLLQVSETLSLLGDGGITSNTTLTRQFINYINQAYWEVFMAILTVDKNWKADDFNYTDYPEAPITLVDSQRDYELPVAVTGANIATLLRVNRVWVLDTQGNRMLLEAMDTDEDFDYITTGIPTKYRLHGKSIYMNVRPASGQVTLTSGLIVQFQRVPDPFAYADLDGNKESTQQPGFMETFHDLLALRASAKYLRPTNSTLAQQYDNEFYARLGIPPPTLVGAISNMDDNKAKGISTKPICHI